MHVVTYRYGPKKESIMPIADTEQQKQYRDAHETDPAVKNQLAAQKCC